MGIIDRKIKYERKISRKYFIQYDKKGLEV